MILRLIKLLAALCLTLHCADIEFGAKNRMKYWSFKHMRKHVHPDGQTDRLEGCNSGLDV